MATCYLRATKVVSVYNDLAMKVIEYATEVVLRPRLTLVFLCLGLGAAFPLFLITVLSLLAHFFDQGHPDMLGELSFGGLLLSAVIFAAGLLEFAGMWRSQWVANASGVDIHYRRRLREHLAWNEITDVSVRGVGVTITRPDERPLRLPCIPPRDGRRFYDLWQQHRQPQGRE
jgi:hypothetical protein